MSNKKSITTLSIAAGTAFVASLAVGNVANAAEGANPFTMNELSSGYMQLAEAKCGGMKKSKGMEGKCGDKSMEKGMKDGKCGSKNKAKKEGKCGEGKCGGKKAKEMNMEKDMKEGKCGETHKKDSEGKCGGKK